MTHTLQRHALAALAAALLVCIGAIAAPGSALAMQVLDATDHAELAAEISATNVNRIALAGDRIAKVVRAPDGYAVEHDATSGDLYLRPLAPASSGDAAGEPVTLFIGTEKGFTYRLTLTPAARDSAQILIRNGETLPNVAKRKVGAKDSARIAALMRLVRAVARREPLPGHEIRAATGPEPVGLTFIETWRGPRFSAHVLEADRDVPEAARLAGTIGGLPGVGRTADGARLAALWLAAPGTGPSGGRLAVAVVETAPAGEPR